MFFNKTAHKYFTLFTPNTPADSSKCSITETGAASSSETPSLTMRIITRPEKYIQKKATTIQWTCLTPKVHYFSLPRPITVLNICDECLFEEGKNLTVCKAQFETSIQGQKCLGRQTRREKKDSKWNTGYTEPILVKWKEMSIFTILWIRTYSILLSLLPLAVAVIIYAGCTLSSITTYEYVQYLCCVWALCKN